VLVEVSVSDVKGDGGSSPPLVIAVSVCPTDGGGAKEVVESGIGVTVVKVDKTVDGDIEELVVNTDDVLASVSVEVDSVTVIIVVVAEVRPPPGVSVDAKSVVVSKTDTLTAKAFAALIEGPAGRQFSMPGYWER